MMINCQNCLVVLHLVLNLPCCEISNLGPISRLAGLLLHTSWQERANEKWGHNSQSWFDILEYEDVADVLSQYLVSSLILIILTSASNFQRRQPDSFAQPAGWRNASIRGQPQWTFKYDQVFLIPDHQNQLCWSFWKVTEVLMDLKIRISNPIHCWTCFHWFLVS